MTTASNRFAIVAGATGQIGHSIANYLAAQNDWTVIGLARKPPLESSYPMISVDLTDRADCVKKLSGLPGATHFIYAARFDHFGGAQESVETNVSMLENLLNAILPTAINLAHIHLIHGTKYYGHTKALRPVPYHEDDPCGNFDSFYYGQQELVKRLQATQLWNWTISRPHAFCDLNTDEPRNLLLLIGIYASVMRACGQPLVFPGTEKAYQSRTQFSWLPALARSVLWMMTSPQCANQAFNIVNGDAPTWSSLWLTIADYFDMPVGPAVSASFEQLLADKDAVWQTLVKQFGLRPSSLGQVVQWPYGDYALGVQWDVISDMARARSAGFTETIDSHTMWRDGLDFYRSKKLIP
jgi:nucleoside-diphosphate-sugar epimerase